MRSTALLALCALLLLGETACSYPAQPGSPDTPTKTVPVLGVKVTPQVMFLVIGETQQVIGEVAPTDATDQALTWESTDPTVATVDAAGLVTAQGVGAGVFITAFSHDGRHQASVNVSVVSEALTDRVAGSGSQRAAPGARLVGDRGSREASDY